jgi:hypothetical protein
MGLDSGGRVGAGEMSRAALWTLDDAVGPELLPRRQMAASALSTTRHAQQKACNANATHALSVAGRNLLDSRWT